MVKKRRYPKLYKKVPLEVRKISSETKKCFHRLKKSFRIISVISQQIQIVLFLTKVPRSQATKLIHIKKSF